MIMQIAASAFILLGAGFGAYFLLSGREVPQVTHVTHQLPEERTLPDQTHVTLNRHSKIQYARDFAGKLREVTLSGEAFFKVTKDAGKPFIVHTPMANVKVVGTAFNVAEGHGELEVSVSEGKVLVMTDHDSIYLQARTYRCDSSRPEPHKRNGNGRRQYLGLCYTQLYV